ncbi:MAG: dUTP diphosphatase [Alphaproteobacteria bacterium]|jgi:dUTP pyrophosphatase|nr:dUTP diphosphatase [Alphaproteobacteria bacterium]
MNQVDVKIIVEDSAKDLGIPSYASEGSAGVDLKANIFEDITLKPQERVLIPTGIFMELPSSFEAQVRSRSGLAIKNGVVVLNSPGTIDSDYRGEIKVILANFSSDSFIVKRGDRIAQMVINTYVKANFFIGTLNDTNRGSGGFGSTGV